VHRIHAPHISIVKADQILGNIDNTDIPSSVVEKIGFKIVSQKGQLLFLLLLVPSGQPICYMPYILAAACRNVALQQGHNQHGPLPNGVKHQTQCIKVLGLNFSTGRHHLPLT
jgi:hypothetical protein